MMHVSQDGLVKVFFEPPDDPNESWHTEVESMWAKLVEEPLAPGGHVFELDNSPWYAFGISYGDQVCAELRHEKFDKPEKFECDALYFTKVWKRSGHSTYTIFLQGETTTESPEWLQYWTQLDKLGCSYEGMNTRLLSVDVADFEKLETVEAIFERALAEGVFAYQTQHRFDPNERTLLN